MLKNLDKDIREIQGIGPQTATRLNQQNVATILDLLVRPSHAYYRIVKNIASRKEVSNWQKMATLMQIDEIDGQFAEAIVNANIKTVALLSELSMGRLRKLFKLAQTNGVIPEVPSTEQLVNIIRDASKLSSTLNVLGQITDKDDQAIPGCKVVCGVRKAETNQNGYFKLALMTGLPVPVVVQTPEAKTFELKNISLLADMDDTNVQVFNLKKQIKVKKELLDEYAGDKLPAFAGQPYVVEHEKTSSLRENDVLLVRSFYKSSPHVKLQSIFSAFDGTRFIARTYKFPIDKLNIEVSERKRYLYRQGEFRSTANSRTGTKAWIKLKQSKSDRPLPQRITNKTIERLIKQRLKGGV